MTVTLTTTAIIPTFNRATFLVETLESVLSQSLPPAEVLIIDDGSTDDTPQRMEAYADRIRYIRKENSGKADSLNQSIGLANHPLVWIVDDDDLVLPHTLETLTGLFRDNPGIGFSYGRYERFTVDAATGDMETFDCGYWQDVPPENFLIATLQDMFVHHPGMLVRKSAYESVGPFSSVFTRSEDYDMLVRLARQYACASTPDTVFLQRQHDGIRSGGVQAHQRNQRWVYEQKIQFGHIYTHSDLTDFLPRDPSRLAPLSEEDRREALITRGSIMARKKMWEFAFEDFSQASEIAPAKRLNAREIASLRAALFSKYGCDEILEDPAIGQQIRKLSRKSRTGSQIVGTLAGSLLWFIRDAVTHGEFLRAAGFARLAFSLSASRPLQTVASA